MGIVWSLVTPILMLGIYTFVFKYIFKARWTVPTADGEVLSFAMILFLGMLVHGMLADILMRSPGLIVENVNFVKKVVFPLETLSWVTLFSTIFNFVIGFFLLLGFVYIELGADSSHCIVGTRHSLALLSIAARCVLVTCRIRCIRKGYSAGFWNTCHVVAVPQSCFLFDIDTPRQPAASNSVQSDYGHCGGLPQCGDLW